MKTLWITCGPSACGKSTWCKERATERDAYISRDEIRLSLLKDGEDYFAHEKEVLRQFYEKISLALKSDAENIYVDATFLTPKARRRIGNLARGKATVIAVDCGSVFPIELALSRNASRTGRAHVPEKAVRDMYKRYIVPSTEEGFDKIIKGE